MLIISLIALQVIIFVGLIFVLRRLLTQNVVDATKHLEEMNEDYTKKEEDINKRYEEVKEKTEQMLAKAQNEAANIKSQAIKDAESQKDKILSQARTQGEEIIQQADKSRQLLLSDIADRINKEALQKASDMIKDMLPDKLKKDVHQYWVNELIGDGFEGLKGIPIPEDLKEITVISAFPLTEHELDNLRKGLKDALSRDIVLKEKTDIEVVAGIIINIGSLVMDGSFKNKIKENIKNA